MNSIKKRRRNGFVHQKNGNHINKKQKTSGSTLKLSKQLTKNKKYIEESKNKDLIFLGSFQEIGSKNSINNSCNNNNNSDSSTNSDSSSNSSSNSINGINKIELDVNKYNSKIEINEIDIRKQWYICKTKTRYIDQKTDTVEVIFPSNVLYKDILTTLWFLKNNLVITSPKISINNNKKGIGIGVKYELVKGDNVHDKYSCKLIIDTLILNRLRVTAIGYYFSVLNRNNIWKRLKTVPIHPLLLRLYSTVPSNYNNSECLYENTNLSNFEPVRLYNFVSIVSSWCNHIDPFVDDVEHKFQKFILLPKDRVFFIYSYLHRLLNLFYDEKERFIDSINKNKLILQMGKFLAIKSICYMKESVFLELRSFYIKIYDIKECGNFVLGFKWLLNHSLVNLLNIVILSNPENPSSNERYIDIEKLCKKAELQIPNLVRGTSPHAFVASCYLLASDPRMDKDLARKIVLSFETNLTLKNIASIQEIVIHTQENIYKPHNAPDNFNTDIPRVDCSTYTLPKYTCLSNPSRFGGQRILTAKIKNSLDYENLIRKVGNPSTPKNNFRMFFPDKNIVKREILKPLVVFLSLQDNHMMRKKNSKPIDINVIGDPDSLSTLSSYDNSDFDYTSDSDSDSDQYHQNLEIYNNNNSSSSSSSNSNSSGSGTVYKKLDKQSVNGLITDAGKNEKILFKNGIKHHINPNHFIDSDSDNYDDDSDSESLSLSSSFYSDSDTENYDTPSSSIEDHQYEPRKLRTTNILKSILHSNIQIDCYDALHDNNVDLPISINKDEEVLYYYKSFPILIDLKKK